MPSVIAGLTTLDPDYAAVDHYYDARDDLVVHVEAGYVVTWAVAMRGKLGFDFMAIYTRDGSFVLEDPVSHVWDGTNETVTYVFTAPNTNDYRLEMKQEGPAPPGLYDVDLSIAAP